MLVPLNGSPFAEAVLPEAIELAQALEGEVVLLRVVPLLESLPPPGVAAWDVSVLDTLRADAGPYLRDVADHVTVAIERIENYRSQLRDILTVNATLVGQRQNEEMRSLTEASFAQSEEVKKISSWAAILFAPSLVGGIYGMNFENMPELSWHYGYPLALLLMLALSVTLYVIFRRRGWL